RAVAALRQAAAALPPDPPARADRSFDSAFREGYFAGEGYAAHSAKPLNDFGYIASYCAASASRKKSVPAAHCPAYTQGFRIGYADARIQQPAPTTASAK